MNAASPSRSRYERDRYDPASFGATEFAALMRNLGVEIGGPVDASLGFACVNLNQVDFVLAHGDAWGLHNLCVACEFGSIPEARRLDVLEAALLANGDIQGLWSPVFSLEPVTDCLILTAALPLFGLEANVLLMTLLAYCTLATNWRQTYFIAVAQVDA